MCECNNPVPTDNNNHKNNSNMFGDITTKRKGYENVTAYTQKSVKELRKFTSDNLELLTALAEDRTEDKTRLLAISALVELNAKDKLLSILPSDVSVGSATGIKAIAKVLFDGNVKEFKSDADVVSDASLSGDIEEVKELVVETREAELEKIKSYSTEDEIIKHFSGNLDLMRNFVKSSKDMKLGRANKLKSVAKIILKSVSND